MKMRRKKQYIPHNIPVTFDEIRTPQGVIDQLKMQREIIPPIIVKVKAVKQPPLPIDEQTREEIKKYLQESNKMAAVAERVRERTEDGKIVITRDELREYENLKAKRDISEASMRARMQENNQKALNLSLMIVKSFDSVGLEKLAVFLGKSAEDIYDFANEILATE